MTWRTERYEAVESDGRILHDQYHRVAVGIVHWPPIIVSIREHSSSDLSNRQVGKLLPFVARCTATLTEFDNRDIQQHHA